MREFLNEYWTVVLALVVAAGAIAFALLASNPSATEPTGQPPAVNIQAGEDEAQQEQGEYTPGMPPTAEEFWARLREREPYLEYLDYECPCDGTVLEAPAIMQNNVFGGVTTDFMGLQLKAPAETLGRPDLSLQLFNDMQVTCPNDLATFEYMDLSNIANGLVPKAEFKLRGWKLADDAPDLAAIPPEEWTSPERHLAHYFTLVRAGFPDYEIGWRTLSGAHAANFALWHGDEYGVPSPVFYALAALHMRRELENPDSQINGQERVITAIMAGELYRLLGRPDDALACCDIAEQQQLESRQQQAIALLRQRANAEDYVLQRDTIIGMEEPPVGWYIEMLLPAVNGHISEHRGNWNEYDDPAEVARQACALLAPTG